MSTMAAESSSARWVSQKPVMSYAAVGPQPVSPVMAEASSPPSVPENAAPSLALIREPARPVVRVAGEPFFVEHDGDTYSIVHDRWSLLGSGDSLAAAYKDLLHMAEVLAPVYGRTPPGKLDAEGTRLAKFLLHSR